ncbi:MAG TPA: hypothetical protein VFV34_15225, partial [Blastocatellia bacterium]|nr:hypothetical protein [Blastocatellia bacterium]
SKLQPALVGGLILGLLSSIPFVKFGNLCCCLWVLLGAALAARSLVNRSPVFPVTYGEGATVGALAGAVGSVVCLFIGVPLELLIGDAIYLPMLRWFTERMDNPDMQRMMNDAIEQAQYQPMGQRLAGALIQWVVFAAIVVAFATLGGVIGIAFFEKRKGQAPPAAFPPQSPPYQGGPQPPYGAPPGPTGSGQPPY